MFQSGLKLEFARIVIKINLQSQAMTILQEINLYTIVLNCFLRICQILIRFEIQIRKQVQSKLYSRPAR
jgi:hypothetical protein